MDTMEPSLAAPGAGLPAFELFFARWMFRLHVWRGNPDSFQVQFEQQRQAIRRLIQDCDDQTGGRRVLIRRLPGLEDSSRHWSVWMTLEHLRIVHGSLIQVISALGEGKTLPGQASTAAVKPAEGITASVIPAYEASCEALLTTVQKQPHLKTAVKFSHPWFGPLDAYGWLAMAPFHLSLHRAQIQAILASNQ